jgi:hypothetical protein
MEAVERNHLSRTPAPRHAEGTVQELPERSSVGQFDILQLLPHTFPLMDRHEHSARSLRAARALSRLFLINLVLIS